MTFEENMGAGTIRVGISGWTYPPWRGVFYPPGLGQADELTYAADHMSSIEINGSFYSLQHPEGILMERFTLDADQAFGVLRRFSQESNRKLRDVAHEIVATGALPAAAHGDTP